MDAQILDDLVTTAVEGGTGYWAQVSVYHWEGVPAVAVLHAMDDPESKGLTLNRDVVRRGLNRLAAHEVKGQHERHGSLARAILHSKSWQDAPDYDADDADVIAQAGIFGEIVYG